MTIPPTGSSRTHCASLCEFKAAENISLSTSSLALGQKIISCCFGIATAITTSLVARKIHHIPRRIFITTPSLFMGYTIAEKMHQEFMISHTYLIHQKLEARLLERKSAATGKEMYGWFSRTFYGYPSVKVGLVSQYPTTHNFTISIEDLDPDKKARQAFISLLEPLGENELIDEEMSRMNKSHEGACYGLCLELAKILRNTEISALDNFSFLSKTLESPNCKTEAAIFNIYQKIADNFGGIKGFISNSYNELRHVYITEIPHEDIEYRSGAAQDGSLSIYPAEIDAKSLYALINDSDNQILVVMFQITQKSGHTILLFSSEKDNKHIFFEPNTGFFSYESKEDLAVGAATNLKVQYPIPLRTVGALAINRPPQQEDIQPDRI